MPITNIQLRTWARIVNTLGAFYYPRAREETVATR